MRKVSTDVTLFRADEQGLPEGQAKQPKTKAQRRRTFGVTLLVGSLVLDRRCFRRHRGIRQRLKVWQAPACSQDQPEEDLGRFCRRRCCFDHRCHSRVDLDLAQTVVVRTISRPDSADRGYLG